MKRTPLARRSPLVRSSSLRRSPLPPTGRRLPAASPRRAAETRIYAARRRIFLAANPACERCGGVATDVHHMYGRVGPDLLDERAWRALCRSDHRWVTEHPAEAVAEGWSRRRLARRAA